MGLNNRQLRLLGLTGLTVLLILVLYNSSTNSFGVSTEQEFVSKIVDSTTNDAQDEAINKEIERVIHGEEVEQQPVGDNLDLGSSNKKVGQLGEDSEEDIDFDPVKELIQIRSLAPMVVFSKTYCPYSKRLKKLLNDNYEITPQFSVVELDKHKSGKLLQEHLAKISGRGTVPNVLIGPSNESKGGCDDFLNLHESGKLAAVLNEWGNKKLSVKKIETPSNL